MFKFILELLDNNARYLLHQWARKNGYIKPQDYEPSAIKFEMVNGNILQGTIKPYGVKSDV